MTRKSQAYNRPATKGDIRRSQEELAQIFAKALSAEIKNLRIGIEKGNEKTRRHFDVVAENIHKDLADTHRSEIDLMQNKQENHEERITNLEHSAGIR